MQSSRAGQYINTVEGYRAFVPNSLPLNPPIELTSEIVSLLSLADRKLGRLDGITQVLPNPDLFVTMYVNKEALLSSQIEGTQASFVDVLGARKENSESRGDAHDVVNYVAAMNYALERLNSFPLSLRLIRETHAVLLREGRGSAKSPGEFRKSQNWIGAPGSTLKTATFIPPTVNNMQTAIGELEKYLNTKNDLPALIKIALIHAQFETIHPFLDGNGRMGRLLITFWLCQQKILNKPLLYLSHYFKLHRAEYYDRLMDVRLKGEWEQWVTFFLKGVAQVSDEAVITASEIIDLKNSGSCLLSEKYPSSNNHQRLYEELFIYPLITRKETKEALNVSVPTANSVVNDFVAEGILKDISPDQKRNKSYLFADYLSIIERGTELNQSSG